MPYLLDADWAIQALVGRQPATTTIDQLLPQGIGISWVTVAEIYEGAFGTTDPQAHLQHLRTFLQSFSLLALNDDIAERFARMRSDLRRQGQIISDFDIVVAATALHYELTVLTFNRRHFARVPGLRIYQPS
jgi:predicted nucleic acid-binding protein